MIALHACNTATDEAIFQGIKAESDLIVVAPCCHQEIRPQIKPPEMLENILKHGIMLEREAELVTDGLRALLLEKSGYATKLFEFIATEHTPKNNMIVGTKQEKVKDAEKLDEQINSIKDFYGIKEQKLESLIKQSRSPRVSKGGKTYGERAEGNYPLAYLITIRSYGTWVHGDEKGSVDRHGFNNYGIAANVS